MAAKTPTARAGAPHIELLPPEIQVHILRRISRMDALLNLISASPRFLKVHQQSREDVISHILYNIITPAAFPIARAVLQQGGLRIKLHKRADVLNFMAEFNQDRYSSIPRQFSLVTSRKLLQDHYVVEHFIKEFAGDRMGFLAHLISPIDPNARPLTYDLSPFVYSRLARALYYIELYGILFNDSFIYDGTHVEEPRYDFEPSENFITEKEISDVFFARLPEWELEELICVREYLFDRVAVYLDRYEEDVRQCYLISPGDDLHEENAEFDYRWHPDEPFWYFFSIEGSKEGIQDRWMEGCLTKGLKAIRRMLDASCADERDMPEPWTAPRRSMKRALDALPKNYDLETSSNNAYACYRCFDTPNGPNMTWFWAMEKAGLGLPHPRRHSTDGYASRKDYDRLRRFGYVIWDNDDMQRMKLLESTGKLRRRLRGTHGNDFRPLSTDARKTVARNRLHETSVEERVRQNYLDWREAVIKEMGMDEIVDRTSIGAGRWW